jgi:hypothetical protein
MAASLGGCGSISSFLAGSMGDYIPAWAGGLPADAPPRLGTPEYEQWLKRNQERDAAAAAQHEATSGAATQPAQAAR